MEFFQELLNYKGFKLLIVVVSLDAIFGFLRAIKERKVNSTIGIDGVIRKVGMIISIFFLSIIDSLLTFNLLGFIPEDVRQVLELQDIGITDVFNILFVIFESLSVFKNMILCKLPIPKKLQSYFEKIMKEFTEEIKQEGE